MKDENILELQTHSEGLKTSLSPSSRGLPPSQAGVVSFPVSSLKDINTLLEHVWR